MLVGVPKEIKVDEYRVGLTPAAVQEFVAHGHAVIVEAGAGAGIGSDDDAYRLAGADIAGEADAIFARADMIVKVKEPQEREWAMLREGQILFTYLHLAPDPAQTRGLLDSGCIGVAYETITDAAGGLPLLAPMSEVAGRLSIEAAAFSMRRTAGGPGLLMGGVPGVAPARVMVIGGGVVGLHAARMAAGLGAEVVILDRSLPRLRAIDELFGGRIATAFSTAHEIERQAGLADAIIGAVLVAGARAPKLITRDMLSRLKPGAVLVDVAIDQGGCFETSRPTTHADPVFTVDGVTHYCVANMPGAVPRTSSYALGNATLPFGLALADRGVDALRADEHLRAGLNVFRGRLTSLPVGNSLDLPAITPMEALAA
ncbi:alanine dehydrogenase [Sphingomonas bacterium]|uniref:alanine dehydrogenase n=1 Tax=Sphingomonas bacterium TaxID=1895847 RepID=UPI0015768603|nr:alanine dehydrogenase [Sphingomonas bacterium]